MNRAPSTFTKELLGAVMTLEYGAALPDTVRSGNSYPVFGSNGIVGNHFHFLVPGPGIVVGRKGSVGAVCWTEEPFWPIDTAYYVIPKQGVNLRWLYWLLSSIDFKQLDTATGVPGLNRNSAYSLCISLPEPAEQARIAAVLDTVDAAIAQTEAIIAKLKQVRAGLLHDLLTRGLDEHGQLRPPPTEAPHLYQDSPLGKIPREWEVGTLGLRSRYVTSGSRGWANYYSNDGPLFLRIGNLTREHINFRFEDIVCVRPPAGSEGARTQTQTGDILISITADLGIIGVVPKGFGEAYVNQHIALVRPSVGVNSRWLGRYLAAGPAARQFQLLNDSGAKAGLNLSAIQSLVIALPKEAEQSQVAQIFDSIDIAIDQEEQGKAKLGKLKSALMSDLLTGRVRVPEGVEA